MQIPKEFSLFQIQPDFFFFFTSSSSFLSDQGPSSNKFANDGSFLQQFMKMQKEKSNSVPG